MVNADITNYSSIKLDYLFYIIGIKLLLEKFFFEKYNFNKILTDTMLYNKLKRRYQINYFTIKY